MPELPEVETIRLGLEKYLVGHIIQNVQVRLAKIFSGDVKSVTGAKVVVVRRRGKGLILDLDTGFSIAVHVKMTGQFIYHRQDITQKLHPKLLTTSELPSIYTHVIFALNNNATLYYNDIRKFGWLKIVKTPDVLALPFFKALGPEPFVDLTNELFSSIVRKAKLPIKQLLMDQKRIAGIGNIYANDALWLSHIDPRRSAASLNTEEIERLYNAVLAVLTEGLKYKGASETNFFHVDGGKGEYQNHFLVYGKTGQPCSRCGTVIERIVIGGRGTFVCPNCQH